MYEQGAGRINLVQSQRILAVCPAAAVGQVCSTMPLNLLDSAEIRQRVTALPALVLLKELLLLATISDNSSSGPPAKSYCDSPLKALLIAPSLTCCPQEYQPRASVVPAKLDLVEGAYGWPYSRQVWGGGGAGLHAAWFPT
jgi:hypothetical protein